MNLAHKLAQTLYTGLTETSSQNRSSSSSRNEKNTQHFYCYRPLNTSTTQGGEEESMDTLIFCLR